MDDANNLPFFIILAATIVATQQLLAVYTVLFDDVSTKWEKRMAKKRKCELTPYKRNISMRYSQPTSALEPGFNLAWHEVRTGLENSYQRVGLWFPVLGNNKQKLPYSEKVLFLAIHAATRLHNWILNTENLSHSALDSPEMLY